MSGRVARITHVESYECTSSASPQRTSSLLLAYAAFDEHALLARAGRVQDGADPLPAALATALLRSIRTLRVTGTGPACVAELSFLEVERALRSCADCVPVLGLDASVALRRWKAHHHMEAWSADAVPWARRLRRAQTNVQLVSGEQALGQCRGRTVTGARRREFPHGALEGAPAIELIFDEGSAAIIASDDHAAPGTLLGSSPQRYSEPGSGFTWHFAHPRPPVRRLAATAGSAVLLQPSPLARAPEAALLY
jgi:hypothetical protein